MLGKEMVYKYTNETAFWGGNEFFNFENKDLRSATSAVRFIELRDLYHSILYTNIERKDRPYTYNPDINGNFLVTAIDVENVNIEADYAWVQFSLLSPELLDEEVFVYGNYNNYALTDENFMQYDAERGIYYANIKLKQGFYNYKFVSLDNKGMLNENKFSGSFAITENNYKVLVYYRRLGGRYDRIIGYNQVDSVKVNN